MPTGVSLGAAEDARAAARRSGLVVEDVARPELLRQVAKLFMSIWSAPPSDAPVSPDLLRALAHAGGYVATARTRDGDALVGASAGFLGESDGQLVLHSHITGVAPAAQGRSVGLALKLHQRAWALQRGLTRITWTFDPLVRRNGWFNLTKLGATVPAYHVDFYGAMADGINAGDESDRCVADWDLLGSLPGAKTEERGGQALLVVGSDGSPVIRARERTGMPLLCQIPGDIVAIRRQDPALARTWRQALRATMGEAVAGGHRATSMTTDGSYVLVAAGP